MKNTLRLDHANGRIIMDRTFAKCAEDTRSEEYRHLQSVRQDYPTYTVIRKQIKQPAHKESYKGLTYDYMRTYINNHEPEDTRQTMSDELEQMIADNIDPKVAAANAWAMATMELLEKYHCVYYTCKSLNVTAFSEEEDNLLLEIYELVEEIVRTPKPAAPFLLPDTKIKTKEEFDAKW